MAKGRADDVKNCVGTITHLLFRDQVVPKPCDVMAQYSGCFFARSVLVLSRDKASRTMHIIQAGSNHAGNAQRPLDLPRQQSSSI